MTMLSIDFDFFTREDPMWDWGHNEPEPGQPEGPAFIYASMVWKMGRYAMRDPRTGERVDLFEATHPKHAGVLPSELLDDLADVGLEITFRTPSAIVDSHRWGLAHYLACGSPDRIISLDAHHDLYTGTKAKLNCGNWLTHALASNPEAQATVVYPAWRSEEGMEDAPLPAHLEPEIAERVTLTGYSDLDWWEDDDGHELPEVTGVLLCRSPVWVPPHHDEAFVDLAQQLMRTSQSSLPGGDLDGRWAPTREDADAMWKEREAQLDELRIARRAP